MIYYLKIVSIITICMETQYNKHLISFSYYLTWILTEIGLYSNSITLYLFKFIISSSLYPNILFSSMYYISNSNPN